MKKALAAAFVVIIGSLAYLGCSSGGSSSAPAPTTGSLTVTGSPTLTNAFSTPLLYSSQATTTISGTPSSVKIKAYKIWISQNASCADPVLVADNTASAAYVDVMTKPTLFTASSVTPGTYHCLILKVSDIFKFTPDATAQAASGGVCVAGTEVSFDILKVETPAENWLDLETGQTVAGEGAIGNSVEQTVFLFASTDNTAISSAYPLIYHNQMGNLTSPFTITAGQTTKAAFVVDTTDRISVIPGNNNGTITNYCWLEGFNAQFLTQ